VEFQHLERLKTPLDDHKHGMAHKNEGRISSRKKHKDSKGGKSNGSVSTE
jgi:hypothetical protein